MTPQPAFNVTGGYRLSSPPRWQTSPGTRGGAGFAMCADGDSVRLTMADASGTTVSLGFHPDTASEIALDMAALAEALRNGT